ncbi:MAG: DUF2156 domain-containing protein [Desulfamplus sp.]|nr:DUF2156 domain-containing protein [Desulfamplus sp.]
MIPFYPESIEIHLDLRNTLHPMLQKLPDGISEFTFANLYLFQKSHQYKISKIHKDGCNNESELFIITGCDRVANSSQLEKFFMLPFGIPEQPFLDTLFKDHTTFKCASESQSQLLLNMGYEIFEDRDNFDYLYKRENLADLPGRHYHKKRNLIKAFVNNHNYEGRPLLEEYLPDALKILDEWRDSRIENGSDDGDYSAAKEALEKSELLQLCGGIYYVEDEPVAYSLGEELACGKSFVIHFEKAVNGYKGLWQFVNQAFASIITEHYETINREQDLGDEGLRHAKLSYHPTDFVKKYKIRQKTIKTI